MIEEKLTKGSKKIPIWFMRQAGRYMEEYRNIRNKEKSFLDLCLKPDLMTEITLQPINKFDFDAAIIFSDILILPYSLGLDLEFIEKVGPVFKETSLDKRLNKLGRKKEGILEKVYEGIKIIKEELKGSNKSLIGFAGSPYTVSCYIIEGRGKTDFHNVRKYFYENREGFKKLIEYITEETIEHLKKQIDSGVDTVKLFDSWAGNLSDSDFHEYVIKPNKKIAEEIRNYKKDITIIAFPKGAGEKNKDFIENVDIDVLAIDHTVNKKWASENLQNKVAIQGNLDNAILTAENPDIKGEVLKVLKEFGKGKFIFNLGHGILPESKIKNVQEVINIVRSYDR